MSIRKVVAAAALVVAASVASAGPGATRHAVHGPMLAVAPSSPEIGRFRMETLDRGNSLHVVCDLTIASRKHARFMQTDANVGSFDGGYGSALLARQVGQKRALEIYQTLGPTDDISEGHKAASNAYVAIRAARTNMGEIKSKKKYADPVLDLAFDKVTKAWNRSRGPVDHVAPPGNGRMPYIQTAMRQMNEVIVALEQILLMWP